MSEITLFEELKNILTRDLDRAAKAMRITEAIREAGPYRWVGIYDVDSKHGLVSNIAWSGPNTPAYLTFPISMGLTSKAIAGKITVNAGDVARDSSYLTALDTTQAELIVPILDSSDQVVGTIDVESEHLNAFDANAQSFLERCAHVLKGFWIASS